MNENGSTTVFFASIFLSVLLLVSVCMEGIYLYVGKGKAAGAYMSSLMSTQGNYQKELHKEYHLFGLDPRYTKKLTKDMEDRLDISLNQGVDQYRYEIQGIKLSNQVRFQDKKAGHLKSQIREYMKYRLGEDGVASLTKVLSNQPEKSEIAEAKNQLQDAKNTESKEETNEEKDDEKQEVIEKKEDPRKGFMKLLKTGIISLAFPKGKKISKETIDMKYGTSEEVKKTSIDFFDTDSVDQSLDESLTESFQTNLTTDLLGVAYATTMFHHGSSKEEKKGTQYEVEYLIAGNDSEEENLAEVLSRMLAMRFLVNRVCLLSDAARVAQATELATAILGITGLPPVVMIGKELLLAALAYGESILDLRNLVSGKEIPVIKSPSQWQLEFTGLATLTGTPKTVEHGFSYENGLQALLLLQKDESKKYLRMLDLMEKNVAAKVPGFSFSTSYVAYQITANINMHTFGFAGARIPFLSKYPFTFQRTVVY